MKRHFLAASTLAWLLMPFAVSAQIVGGGALPSADASSYPLAPGDKLRITVFNEARLTGEFGISAAGNIAYPMVGAVMARGLTAETLQQTIHDRLAAGGFISDALVNVEVVAYRPYYILGEVNKPGEYPYAVGLTLRQAVAAAGGYTYRANRGAVFVERTSAEKERRIKTRSASPLVMPGDTIRVGERYF